MCVIEHASVSECVSVYCVSVCVCVCVQVKYVGKYLRHSSCSCSLRKDKNDKVL